MKKFIAITLLGLSAMMMQPKEVIAQRTAVPSGVCCQGNSSCQHPTAGNFPNSFWKSQVATCS